MHVYAYVIGPFVRSAISYLTFPHYGVVGPTAPPLPQVYHTQPALSNQIPVGSFPFTIVILTMCGIQVVRLKIPHGRTFPCY